MKSRQLRRNKLLRRNKTQKRGGGPLLEQSVNPYTTALQFVQSKLDLIRDKDKDTVLDLLKTLITPQDLNDYRGDDWVINGVWAAIGTYYLTKNRSNELSSILLSLRSSENKQEISIAESIDRAIIGFRVVSLPSIR
jgi:hypothetical protein